MLRIALAGLLTHRLRLILTAMTIMIGVALVSGTFILTDSLEQVLRAPAAAAVVVQSAVLASSKGAAAVTVTPGSVPAGLVARVRSVPGVADAAGTVIVNKVTLIGKDGQAITHVRALSEVRSYPAGRLAAQYTLRSGHPPRGPGQALLDAATARRLGYRPGDPIGVATPHGIRTLTVTGITGFDGADSPAAEQVSSFDVPTVVLVPPETAQQLAGLRGQFTEIDIQAAPQVAAAVLLRRVSRVLPPGIVAVTGEQAIQEQYGDAASAVTGLRTDLLAFCAMALLVAAFVIANTFAILAAQRAREHALARLIGMTRGQLLRSVLSEAALLGLAASAVGAGLGILAAAGLRGLIALLGGILPPGGLTVAPVTITVALLTGTAVTVAAALQPARRAARVAPVRALREASLEPPCLSCRRLASGLTGCALGAVLMIIGLRGQAIPLIAAGALAALAGLLATGPFLARLTAGGMAARGITVQLARDNAAGNPRRTTTAAAALLVGVAIATAASMIAASVRASAMDAAAGGRADLYLQGIISPHLARAVAAQPGVSAVMREDDPWADFGGTRARVAGIDPAGATSLVNLGVRSSIAASLRGQRVLVFAGQAAARGWRTGSRLTADFGQGPQTLTVAGTFTDRQFLGADYLMPITTLFRDMPDQKSQAELMLVRTARGAAGRAARARIAALLTASPGTILQTAAQYSRSRAADLGDLSRVLALLTALALLTDLIAILGIASSLTLALTERTRELGVLRALGLTRRQLAAMITTESVITCLLGALPGTALGIAAGTALADVLTAGQTGVVTIQVPAAQLAALLAGACLAGLLAALIPAVSIARLPVLRAITE